MNDEKRQRKKVQSKNMMNTMQRENDDLKNRLDEMLSQANIGKDGLQKQMALKIKELADKEREMTEMEKQHQAELDAKEKVLLQRGDEVAKAGIARDAESKRVKALEKELEMFKAELLLSKKGLKICNETVGGKDEEIENLKT